MAVVQLATTIDVKVKKLLDTVCELRGLKINRFIEDAVLDKIEEMEDLEDIKKIRKEKTISLSNAILELKNNGKI